MNKKVYFLFGVHNHQPVGNFDSVFDKAYEDAYKPLLDVLNDHPEIKYNLHCSGMLWDYFKAKQPEYISVVKQMVKRKQVELLTGGYYEPILPSIPEKDRIGQILKMTQFIKSEFGYTPRGMWLAERVWDGFLSKVLAQAGVEYTLIDDYHFLCAGLGQEELGGGYYISEQDGHKLKIFPISQILRYYIPFKNPEDVINFFHSLLYQDGTFVLSMADDGEKFGLWPGTKNLIYGEKWLDRFLTLVKQNSFWLETLTFSEFIDRYPSKGRIYLPSASYFEMTEWCLPAKAQVELFEVQQMVEAAGAAHADKIKKFMRGGIWQNFLVRYPESNNMQKKMAYLSNKVTELAADTVNDPAALDVAQDLVWQGQCNCAYWHGVFGGLYLPHLRYAIYKKLIGAENELDKIRKDKQNNKITEFDIDCDSQNEVVWETKKQNLYIAPHYGGSIYEWDIKEKEINLLNVLTRREEAYHLRLKHYLTDKINESGIANDPSSVKSIHELVKFKEKNLDQYLNYDWYRKVMLLDHFIHPNTKYEDFSKCKYGEQGDFVLGNYSWKQEKNSVKLARKGSVWCDDRQVSVTVEKLITMLKEPGIRVNYRLTNHDTNKASFVFGPELNFSLAYFKETEDLINEKTSHWARCDDGWGTKIELDVTANSQMWVFPLYTVSLSEDGFERIYQGTTVFPCWFLTLDPDQTAVLDLEIKVY
jgi:alpha-amylase